MKRSKVIGLIAALSIAALMFTITGCQSKRQIRQTENGYPASTAEVISHATSGRIYSTDSIVLRFVNPVIQEEQVGEKVEKQVFFFDPDIEGTASWKDRRTLVFKPAERLPFRRTFKGEARFNELFPQYEHLDPMTIGFSVPGRDLLNLEADFKLVNKYNPSLLRYGGTITFNEMIDIERLKKAVSFSEGRKELPLEWQMKKENRVFTFISPEVKRKTKTRYFSLKIDKKTAQLSAKFDKVIELAPLKELKITAFRKFDQGEKPGIEITFSDDLDPRQDKTGLVRVERNRAVKNSAPYIETAIKTLKKSLYLEGNFTYGESFTIKISGIKSKWGTRLKQEYVKTFDFEDKKPELSFISSGVFLPSANQQKLGFKTINLKRVHLEVKKVFESNLGQFLQTEKISSRKRRNVQFNHQYVNRVGVSVAHQTLKIGDIKNKWLTHQLDLKKLIKPGEKGLFLVRIYFDRAAMMYGGLDDKNRYYYGKEYYSNPNAYGYIHRHGSIYKPVVLSDIGLLVKQGANRRHTVFATDIIKAVPMKDVKITLRTFQNQVITTAFTDSDGKAVIDKVNQPVYYIEGEKNGQRSFIQPKEMAWNISSFDTGGEEDPGHATRAYIYTDRGVYRPGDEAHITLIARNWDNSFPDAHPVTMQIYNPKNQMIYKKTSSDGKDGFYSFLFKSKPEDMTGNWRAVFHAGSRSFSHTLKIETVAPYRLKVNIEPGKKEYGHEDEKIAASLQSQYLFGSPAASLKADVTFTLKHTAKHFSRFPGFTFDNESVKFKAVWNKVFDGNLDEQGRADMEWRLPDLSAAPSALVVQVTAKVFEKGGRATRNDCIVPVHPFAAYIGLQKPKPRIKPGAKFSIPVILVNRKGEPLPGRKLKYTVYRNSCYWWWEYDNYYTFRVRYKKDHYTRPIKEGFITSQHTPVTIDYMPEISGEYLVEVEEATNRGHKAGFFFSSRYYGEIPGSTENENVGTLVLGTDKPVYLPGETAVVHVPDPGKGTILVSLEKGSRVLQTWLYDTSGLEQVKGTSKDKQGKLRVSIPVTREMVPNAYVSVAVIQPHSQTRNDRPIRMYGIIPLKVKDPDTEHRLEVSMVDSLKSNEKFDVEIASADGKPTQFTIAVVDEGLLDITRFPTPNPWAHFFKKQRLSVLTFDLFPYVIGAHKGDIFRLFSIGGGVETAESYRASQMDRGKSKRFKPVALFKGPISTDENGHANVSFTMPNYIGSVRVMVIGARGGSYSRAEKTVPVKTDLMVLPRLPRVLSPGDRIDMPVSVFALSEEIKQAAVSVTVTGPLKIEGTHSRELTFEKPGEKDIRFILAVPQAVGKATVTVTASSPQMTVGKKTEITVRANSPRIYDSKIYHCKPGQKIEFPIPEIGIPGSNHAVVSIVRKPDLNLNHRLQWLIRYPYGCIEQTTSSVFPQLYLKAFLKKSAKDELRIDNNINGGIRRLRRFLTPSGAFAYWPGYRDAHIWGTNYGFHFIIEAKKLGYHVPEDMLKGLLRFQKSRALMEKDAFITRTYRLYLLALAGEAQIGPMNLLKENHMKSMNDTEKWLLAAAYYLSGRKAAAKHILQKAGMSVNNYNELGGTFGSGLRDKAIILELATLTEDWTTAVALYDDIVKQISGNRWYSTQTLGYSMLAVGKYIHVTESSENKEKYKMAGYLTLPGRDRIEFETDKLRHPVVMDTGFSQTAEVYIDKNSSHAYVLVEWNGVPMNPVNEDVSRNLTLDVEWLDEMGDTIDPSVIKQGTTFWGHFRVNVNGFRGSRLDELALVQVLPSGWEIENTRLLKEEKPTWMKDWKLNNEEYLDIRDDRVMWFFDLPRHQAFDFVVKLNAVTVGQFTLPPTLFEAMYDDTLKAVRKGGKVRVIGNHDGHEGKKEGK